MHFNTAKTRVCTGGGFFITCLSWRNFPSRYAPLLVRITTVDKFEVPQIIVLSVPSHFEEMHYFRCGCHRLLFAGMWELSFSSVCQSPTFPVQLLPSWWWKESCCQEHMREEGEGALGRCVMAGRVMINGERKEKPARLGQSPLSSCPIKEES